VIQYQGGGSGDLDVMLMAWLPTTHAAFWARVSREVVDLGPIYSRARIGWVVPSYVPESELASIEDLKQPAVRERLGGRVQGIDPGLGLMQASERALDAYGLDGLQLVSASGAAMTAALDRAIRRHEWIVVTAWNPHWMFARYDLRYLDDPNAVFGGEERVHALVSRRFARSGGSGVNDFLTRLFIPRKELEQAMLDASEQGVAYAVSRYIDQHAARVAYWVTGEPEGPAQ
jgi:glycine betaine/proline transport system substrate-binding protein